MNKFLITFPSMQTEIKVDLLYDKAPKTCEGFWDAIENPIETSGNHAMYTGREISIQLPFFEETDYNLSETPKENLTCFPLPGDILFTYMPEYAFGGNPNAIYDIGVFYGRDARTFFPMGWLPGNLFAQISEKKELAKIEKLGNYINKNGMQKVLFSQL